MTNRCDEISDPTLILVPSRIAQDHDPIKAGSFVESDRIEKSWADEKLVIRSLFHSDRIFSGIGPRWSCRGSSRSRNLQPHSSTPLWVGLSQRPQRSFRQRKPASQGNRMQPRWRQESRVRPPRKDRQFRGPSVSQKGQLASVHHHAVCHPVPLTHHLCHLQPSRSCHPHLSP